MFNVKMEAAKAAIKALIAQHMDNLEQQLKLEREYPEWSEEGDEKFEKLEHMTYAVTRQIADALALALHPTRYQAWEAEGAKDAAMRIAQFEQHEERHALVERA